MSYFTVHVFVSISFPGQQSSNTSSEVIMYEDNLVFSLEYLDLLFAILNCSPSTCYNPCFCGHSP